MFLYRMVINIIDDYLKYQINVQLVHLKDFHNTIRIILQKKSHINDFRINGFVLYEIFI